ncbi:hypothetical protein ACHLJU_10085, partial [Pediococcus acidilactici]|uniref:hypothetical protein n=1 Tax=Pediococcus acidilactici TaxID=1254 RepID=UPI003A8D9C69
MATAGVYTFPIPCKIPDNVKIQVLNKMETEKTDRTAVPALFSNSIVLANGMIPISPAAAPAPTAVLIFKAACTC